MREPVWVDLGIVVDVHAESLAQFGGPSGVRDRGALEAALDRPRNRYAYGEVDLVLLATAYVFGIAKGHPFVDGNKRSAFATMIVFLELNGLLFTATEDQATAAVMAIAAGELGEDAFATWLAANVATDV